MWENFYQIILPDPVDENIGGKFEERLQKAVRDAEVILKEADLSEGRGARLTSKGRIY